MHLEIYLKNTTICELYHIHTLSSISTYTFIDININIKKEDVLTSSLILINRQLLLKCITYSSWGVAHFWYKHNPSVFLHIIPIQCIDLFYNRKRINSSLSYLYPLEFEKTNPLK